jgi:hypothetical protein
LRDQFQMSIQHSHGSQFRLRIAASLGHGALNIHHL